MFTSSNSRPQSADLLLQRLRQIVSVARLHPFDTTTPDGRSQERLRRIFWSAATSMFAKVMNTVAILVSVPITLAYLGNERYGLWMTITSVVTFLGFADLGIGNVILNLVSESSGRDDTEAARRNISNAFCILTLIATVLGGIFVFFYPSIQWNQFFNVSSELAKRESGPAMAVFVTFFLLNLPLSIIPRIQAAYQEGYFSNLWQAVSNILSICALFLCVDLKVGLPWLVVSITGFSVIGNLLNGLSLFGYQRPALLPRWQDVQRGAFTGIVQVGLSFLILQIALAVIYSSDNIVIAKILGPEDVTAFAVPMRLFIILPNLIYMFLSPLWPAYGEAIARGDTSWARTTLIKSVLLTFLLSFVTGALLVIFGETILNHWTGSRIENSFWLMLGMAVGTIISTILSAINMFLNAVNKIAFQAFFCTVTAVVSTILKIVIARPLGLPSIVWGQCLVSILCMLVPYTIYISRRFSKSII